MTTTTFRPFYIGEELRWYERLNWKWVLARLPILLFAAVSSYGVSHFLSLSGLPFPFDTLGGISFDVGFLGTIMLGEQQLSKTRMSQATYYALNLTMSGLAALFNVLSHSGGRYSNISAEDITAGAPFAIVGLVFALYYHSIMSSAIDKELDRQQKEQADLDRKSALELELNERRLRMQLEKEEFEAANPYICEVCNDRKPNKKALSNHMRSHKAQ